MNGSLSHKLESSVPIREELSLVPIREELSPVPIRKELYQSQKPMKMSFVHCSKYWIYKSVKMESISVQKYVKKKWVR